MKLRFLSLSLFFFLGLFMFSSCEKENLDLTTTEEENSDPIVTTCDLEMEIDESTTGVLTANVTGGTAPYLYTWSTGETSNSITATSGGDYSVEAIDAEGCTIMQTITISGTNLCNGLSLNLEESSPGVLVASVTGGTAPFLYNWSTGETSSSITVVAEGDYFVEIIDSEGCTVTQIITVMTVPCNGLSLTLEESSPGVLVASADGGIAPYLYEWSTGETTSIPSITVTSSGTYIVTVIDANGCTAMQSITISDPGPCNSLMLEFNVNAGILTAVASGGTPAYSYLWTSGETTSSIPATPGTHGVTIVDSMGCAVVDEIQL